MDINRNKWHYKVITGDCFFMDGWYASRSLCVYFWQVVARFHWCLFVFTVAVSPLATAIVLGTGTAESSYFLVKVYASVGVAVSLLYGILLSSFVGFLIVEGIKYVYNKFPRKHEEPSKPKEPSIIIEYIKAKKAKVCPRLNFTD
jgi:predicted PurR-regulated permease PerM